MCPCSIDKCAMCTKHFDDSKCEPQTSYGHKMVLFLSELQSLLLVQMKGYIAPHLPMLNYMTPSNNSFVTSIVCTPRHVYCEDTRVSGKYKYYSQDFFLDFPPPSLPPWVVVLVPSSALIDFFTSRSRSCRASCTFARSVHRSLIVSRETSCSCFNKNLQTRYHTFMLTVWHMPCYQN